MKLRPLGYQVLVEIEKLEEKEDENSLIIKPVDRIAREQEAHSRGWVRGIGNSAFGKGSVAYEETPPKIGAEVLIASYTGIKEERDGKIYKLLRDEEILAVREG